MIARNHRFHGLNSLRTVYKYGQTARHQQLSLRYRLNDRRRTYRCAVVVSKKVNKSAVGRNRMRRRIFEVVRQLEPRINKPYDLVISVFSTSILEIPSQDLTRQITELLTSASVLDAVSTK